MWLFKQQSSSAQAALVYVTAGALLIVWTAVWFFYLNNHPPEGNWVWYVCAGSLLSGLVLLVIGLGVGQIGRSARQADSTVQAHPEAVVTTPSPVATGPGVAAAPGPQPVVTDTTPAVRMPSANGGAANVFQGS